MDQLERIANANTRSMAVFDAALGTAALVAPRQTLAFLGHKKPSKETEWLFRRCGPIWLTFAAAHATAAVRGRRRDWWALAWLRATEIATDAVWAHSPGFKRPGARVGLWMAGAGNLAMAAGYATLAERRRRGKKKRK